MRKRIRAPGFHAVVPFNSNCEKTVSRNTEYVDEYDMVYYFSSPTATSRLLLRVMHALVRKQFDAINLRILLPCPKKGIHPVPSPFAPPILSAQGGALLLDACFLHFCESATTHSVIISKSGIACKHQDRKRMHSAHTQTHMHTVPPTRTLSLTCCGVNQ